MHVVLALQPGGLERVVCNLARAQRHNGHDVSVVCLQEKGVLGEQLEHEGIEISELGKGEGLRFRTFLELIRLVRRKSAEIVHTHNIGPLVYGTLAARVCGVPSVNTRHGRTDKHMYAAVWRLNKTVVVVSEDTKSNLLAYNRVPGKKLRVIRNGVDTLKFTGGCTDVKCPTSARDAREPLVLGTVGRLSPEKGYEVLLDALVSIRDRHIPAKLLIVGDGPSRAAVEEGIQRRGLGGSVVLLGYRSDVEEIMRTFDVFVLSSHREGLPLVILEAMAAAIPVIATDVGGTREVVRDGVTGYLVSAGDSLAIADRVQCLYEDRGLVVRMGAAARARAQEQGSLDRMAREYEEVYRCVRT